MLFSIVAQVQKPAPAFTLPAVVDGEFKDISLSDYKGKYVVFFWYPMDFTFVCPTEILAFSERVKEFEALDTAVIAASTDSGTVSFFLFYILFKVRVFFLTYKFCFFWFL